MRLGVDTERLEGAEVQLLRVPGVRLEDHLKLRVALHPVGIVTVAGVIGADGGLGIAHAPGLGAERTEEGGGVHGPRADLGVVRQPEGATAVGPVLLEPENRLLESWDGRGSAGSLRGGRGVRARRRIRGDGARHPNDTTGGCDAKNPDVRRLHTRR